MKKKGFALMVTVVTMAIILGIFFNFSRATRSKKKMLQSSLSNQSAEKSVQEANGVASYEMYLADQMITANNLKIFENGGGIPSSPMVGQATAIQNIVGYFTVKDSIANDPTLTDQVAAVKIWDADSTLPPVGEWYHGVWSGTSPNFKFNTFRYPNSILPNDNFNVPITKGGYIITSIYDITNKNNPVKLFSTDFDQFKTPILNTSSGQIKYPASVGNPRGKMNYIGLDKAYEVKLFKNITLFKNKDLNHLSDEYDFNKTTKEVIRSYNAYVTLIIRWSNDSTIRLNDTNMRNNCSIAPYPGVTIKVGADCGTTPNPIPKEDPIPIASEVISYVLEDITPVIE